MLFRRLFGSSGLVTCALAAVLILGPVAIQGCGGGEEKKTTKKKKTDKPKDDGGKAGTKKADDGGGSSASSDPDIEAKEIIKDTFKGVYEEYMQGNSTIGNLVSAVRTAEEELAKLKRTSWNDKFETDPGMLNDAKVEVAAEYDSKAAKQWALENLEQVQEGIAKLEAIREMLKKIPRANLVKTEMVDNRAKYDDTLKYIESAIAEVQDLSSLVKRTPPSGEINYLDLDKDLWSVDKTMDWTLAAGTLVLEGKDKYQMITAMHYYLKDFRARISFTITQGGFDMQFRSLPGKSSTMNISVSSEQFQGNATIVVTVQGNNIRFDDPEGNPLDEFASEKAPTGGGISFLLRSGSSVNITELTVEPLN